MHYHEVQPAGPVRRYIRCYWFLAGAEGADDAGTEPALPDGSPELILNFGDPFESISPRRAPIRQPLIMLVGQITAPFAVRPTGRVDVVAARLEPFGAVGLCPTGMSSLTNRWANDQAMPQARLDQTWQAVRDGGSVERQVAILDQHLAQVFAAGRQPDSRVEAAVQSIRASGGTRPLEQIATSLGTSPRNLQRLFAAEVGITPKMLARITRFQRVFSAWRSDPASLSRIAADCGYFDQSHLIRDFRDFAGKPAAAFLAAIPEFTRFFIEPEPKAR